MVKKENKKAVAPHSYNVKIYVILLAIVIGFGIWQWPILMDLQDRLVGYVDNKDIITLETKFLPEQILESHREQLLGGDKRVLQNTIYKYYPYLLFDVKYIDAQKTREGILLWGLYDGEMVLNTDTWEVTHGFRDCLECQATRNEFKILQSLARRQGSMSFEELQKELRVDREILDPLIDAAKQKHLIVQRGNLLKMHFENPKLLVTPQTSVNQQFVSKPRGDSHIVAKTYSRRQIVAIAQAAFGNEFKIASGEKEVFLPVYAFEIINPDGSIKTSEWNAVTGESLKLPSTRL